MSQKERYEIIITSKLESLPILDMADAIWSRIEAQLDLDLPTDDGSNTPVPEAPTGGSSFWMGAAFLAFVGALFTYFYFPTSQTKSQPQTTTTSPVSSTPDTLQTIATPAIQAAAQPGKQGKQVVKRVSNILDERDSATAIPDVAHEVMPPVDSGTSVATISSVPGNQQEPDSIPKKKRGLQGLNDKDYRIVPKKD